MMIDENDKSKRAWGLIAKGYDQYVTDTEEWLANEALQRVDLRSGQRFLDVAAGSGGLSLPAARLGANVIATDWAPEMIRLFEKRVDEENLTNAKGLVMDGHHLEFEDNRFDVSGSLFGVMLFPDQPRAIREMVRVTKPGGKVLTVGYGTPDNVEFLKVFVEGLRQVRPQFPGLPVDPPPPEFQAADPEVLKERLEESGLGNVRVDTVTETLEFSSGQQLWDWILNGNPIVRHILSELDLSDDEVESVKHWLDQKIRGKAGERGSATLGNMVNIGFGTK